MQVFCGVWYRMYALPFMPMRMCTKIDQAEQNVLFD